MFASFAVIDRRVRWHKFRDTVTYSNPFGCRINSLITTAQSRRSTCWVLYQQVTIYLRFWFSDKSRKSECIGIILLAVFAASLLKTQRSACEWMYRSLDFLFVVCNLSLSAHTAKVLWIATLCLSEQYVCYFAIRVSRREMFELAHINTHTGMHMMRAMRVRKKPLDIIARK